jgi:hypothetical protein
MRLRPEKLDLLCERIFAVIEADKDCQFIRDEQMIRDEIREIFYHDLRREDDIEEEIREKLEEHRDQLSRGDVSFMDLCKRAKKQIARQRGLKF